MSERIPACKFVASDQPRILPGRHGENCLQEATGADLTALECSGCLPCTETHCYGDGCRGRNHSETICADCLTAAREDLGAIRVMCGMPLLEEVLSNGANTEAAMLLGPAADPEAWANRAMSAMRGRVDAAYLDDCRDEAHPLWTLATWEQVWRDALDQPSDLKRTIPRAGDYLGRTMHVMAERLEPPFDEFARDLRLCRAHLEDVISEGLRSDSGAPCVQCGETMSRVTNDRAGSKAARREGTPREGAQDAYECKPCRRTVTSEHYRYAVGVAYLAHADRLTASDMLDQYGVKGGSVRGWASKGLVRKRGKDANGLQLYDVADVLAAAGKNLEEVS